MRDQNSNFFHATTQVRMRRNRISTILRDNGEWAVEDQEIRAEFVAHFKNIYT